MTTPAAPAGHVGVEPMEGALALISTVEAALRGRRPEGLARAIFLLAIAERETIASRRAADLASVLASIDEASLELSARRGAAEVDHAGVTLRGRLRSGPRELSHAIVTLAVARRLVARLEEAPRPRAAGAGKADRAKTAAKGARRTNARPRAR